MLPGFKLNCHNRDLNPCFESHDPSMMKDPISGNYYSYSTDSAICSEYKQGIPIRKSSDLVNFTYIGTALSEAAVAEARDNGVYPPTAGFWAPFVEYVNGEYRLYYSATKAFGSSESKIWLAVSSNPEGPFENRGVVADTWFTGDDLPNAIDPHIIDDKDGRKFMVYGSYFGGIYIKELDVKSGLSIDGDARSLGKRLAVRPNNYRIDGPEGAAIIYCKETDYYYLFFSYGWLGENYDIRVARSKVVEGPYLDFEGNDVNGKSYGLKLANSYCFKGENPYADEVCSYNQLSRHRYLSQVTSWTFDGFRGPGHGVPFYDWGNDSYYFVHHIRDGAPELKMEARDRKHVSYLAHYMMIRKMLFVDGWPVLSPEPYCGEFHEIVDEITEAPWEWIELDDMNNGVKRSQIGRFDQYDKNRMIVMKCYDFENSRPGICATGITSEGVCFWGKKVDAIC